MDWSRLIETGLALLGCGAILTALLAVHSYREWRAGIEMSEQYKAQRRSFACKRINARPDEAYEAFVDPEILVQWLPPAEMTGKIHEFDATVGGGYRMSLFYPDSETTYQGKTTEKEDRVDVRFVELDPPRKIVEAIRFVSDDPAFGGEMTMTVTFEPVEGGTEVTLAFRDLPPGLKPEDNDEGARLSLDQLARRFE